MVNEKPKIEISKKKKWLRRIFIMLAIIVLLPIGLFTLGWLNRDSLIEQLQEWYGENHSGNLTIGDVNANFLSGFPNVSFTIEDIRQNNTDSITDQYSTMQIEQANVIIGTGNLLRGDIKFKKIIIKNAVITSEVISNRSFEYHEQLKINQAQQPSNTFKLPDWLNDNGATISLENVKYIEKDIVLNKNFDFHIHNADITFKGNDIKKTGTASLNVTINSLGFNTKKGSFGNGARIKGQPKFTIDLKKGIIEIPEFTLAIDDQNFSLTAGFNLSKANSYTIEFKNEDTDFVVVKGLLNTYLADKIKNYKILNPFKSTVKIAGTFELGNDPDINATFSTTANDIIIADKFEFKNTSFDGYLTTDIYTNDSLRSAKKSSKDIKIAFSEINANLEDITVNLSNAFYQSTPESTNFVEATIALEGPNQSLTTALETDNFDFRGGRFVFNAAISGDIPNAYQFLNSTIGNFKLSNTQVILKKNGLQLPIQTIALELDRENSNLRQLVITLPNEETLELRGQLKNISGILSKEPSTPTTSRIYLDSDNLNVNEVIEMAKSMIPKSDKINDDRKTLHETLEAVYGQFHPAFSININSLQFNDVVINDLTSNIQLVNSETILLQNFDFTYFDAITNLKGNVIVHGPESNFKDAIYINAQATSDGPITVFRELFNIELVRIDSGAFQFSGNVKGNIKEFSELLNNAEGDLALKNAHLYYEPTDMEVVIDSLSLFVDNSDIILKTFDIEVDEKTQLNLTGSIEQFPSFLLDDVPSKNGSISLKINAPFLNGDELLSTIQSFKTDEKNPNNRTKKALHRLFKDVNKFNPKIELDIDSLQYEDLITENIKALLYFENDSILKLGNLDLRYKETSARIEGSVNAHTSQEDLSKGNPFDLDFYVNVKGKSEDLNDYLKTSNFIFKSGEFEFKGNYNAQSEELDIMNSKTFGDLKISNTQIDYKAANLQIPVDSLHVEINDDVATLKTLDIKLPGKSSIDFSGSIDNFSDFINGSLKKSVHSSTFAIKSPYLDTSDIQTFFKNATLTTEKKEDSDFNLQTFKQALNGINESFYPSIEIDIDTLRHKKIDLTKFGLDLYFDIDDNLKMDETRFEFYGGSVSMNVEVGMTKENNIPVTISMQAADIDIHELVTRFEYFDNEDLRNADKIEGNLNFSMDAIGALLPDGKVDMNSLNGILRLDIADLALYNFKPIMDNSVLMKNERFEHLRFRPIVQAFEIREGVLIIPRTEIQSSAIQVFIEGRMKFKDYMNVWLSVPWKNLKHNDGLTLPDKTTYENAGSKFFIQLLQDKNKEKVRKQNLKVKLRLSNRKLKKQRITPE